MAGNVHELVDDLAMQALAMNFVDASRDASKVIHGLVTRLQQHGSGSRVNLRLQMSSWLQQHSG